HWSAVLAARGNDSQRARAALETLCRTYWYPLYAYVRRLGHSPHDTEDLIQGFFEQVIEKDYFASADQEKGRFRSFLLVALKRFMANQWNHQQTQKRGGATSSSPAATPAAAASAGVTPSAEERYTLEPTDNLTPDKLFDRRWALTLLETVLARLESESRQAGKAHHFERL